jgi:uncharacterized protein
MSEQRRSVPLGRIGLTLLAGALGGALFSVFSLPAAWMSGSLVGVALLVVFRIDPVMPKALRDLGFLLAGAVTGSSITPEMLQAVARYPLSLVILAVTTLAIIYLGQWVLMRFFRWDAHSALFGAMPGALSAVIASVDDAGGDMMRVITVQTFRIFVLISVLPGAALLSAPVMGISAGQTLPAGSFAVMMIFGTIAALLFHRWRVMAPYLFGGMAAAAALHLGGQITGAPPVEISSLAMLLVGTVAGSRFSGLTFAIVRSLFMPAFMLFLATSVIAAVGGLFAAWLIGIPPLTGLVAYAPGGLEAMIMLGIAMGLDPLYITSHHVARFVLVSLAVPVMARAITPKDRV